MKNCDEYKGHVKECWDFAQEVANGLVDQEMKGIRMAFTISIFEKVCTPYHYFLEGEESIQSIPPTEKQVGFARQLGIIQPEKMSKQQLSEEIDKAVKSGKK